MFVSTCAYVPVFEMATHKAVVVCVVVFGFCTPIRRVGRCEEDKRVSGR